MATANESIKAAIRKVINALGYDLVGYIGGSPRGRLDRLIARHGIGVILDVGANEGAFAWDMRELGFAGRIVSFEPRQEAFALLSKASAGDGEWHAVQCGLGDRDEERTIHIAANAQSSSLLPMLEAHRVAAPESIYRTEEKVCVRRLDGIFAQWCRPGDRPFLKI